MSEEQEADSAPRERDTGQFRAFAGSHPEQDMTQPWSMRASRDNVVKLAVVAVGVAVVLAVLAFLVIG